MRYYRVPRARGILIGTELIQEVAGYIHHRYIKEKILDSLELKNTYGPMRDVNINDVRSS
jgi:D-alanyl-D-alanine carboxypeptidase